MKLHRLIEGHNSSESDPVRYRQNTWIPRMCCSLILILTIVAWWPGTQAHASGRSVFALEDGSGTNSLVVPYFDSDSIISIKNVGTMTVTVTVEYRDLAGNDLTPGANSFILIDSGTVRWAPSAGSPPSLDSVGNPIPGMLAPGIEGSAIITATEPLVGQLEIERVGETIAFPLPDGGGSATLLIPYMRTGSSIALSNVGNGPANYTIEYRDMTGAIITVGNYALPTNATDYFAPFADEPGLTGVEASVIVTSNQPLAGQLEFAGISGNGGVSLQSPSGSMTLAIPSIRAGSFIAVTNVGVAPANFSVEYRDLAGGSPVIRPHTLAVNATERWEPFVDEAGLTGTEVNAIITSDQLLLGQLELSLVDGSTGVSRLQAGTTLLAVPYMRAGSTISVKSASGAATTVTVTYSDPAGATIIALPRSIAAGATDVWDPFAEEPGLAGMDEASAAIVSLDSLVAQLELASRSGGSGGGGCFIATAAYGTPLSADIDALRVFRDAYLMDTALGAAFTDAYYRVSPPLAYEVSQSPILRDAIRLLLGPVVFAAAFINASGLETFVLLLIITVVVGRAARRLKTARANS